MEGYQLLDTGDFEKLERWGFFVLQRPDPQAFWQKGLSKSEWDKSDAVFDKKWIFKNGMPKGWDIFFEGLTFGISLSSFKHTGVFPEHKDNWEWISLQTKLNSKILNLFGYTGGATLAAAKSGGELTHVDSSKISVEKAKENAKLSGLESAPIRWLVDDAEIFVKKEIGRGNKYDGIILDPPSFGRGAKGEVWKIEKDLIPLLENCKKILKEGGFLLLNGYAEGYSGDAYAQLLSSVFNIPLSQIESGHLCIPESSSRHFLLPAGIYARFSKYVLK